MNFCDNVPPPHVPAIFQDGYGWVSNPRADYAAMEREGKGRDDYFIHYWPLPHEHGCQ